MEEHRDQIQQPIQECLRIKSIALQPQAKLMGLNLKILFNISEGDVRNVGAGVETFKMNFLPMYSSPEHAKERGIIKKHYRLNTRVKILMRF